MAIPGFLKPVLTGQKDRSNNKYTDSKGGLILLDPVPELPVVYDVGPKNNKMARQRPRPGPHDEESPPDFGDPKPHQNFTSTSADISCFYYQQPLILCDNGELFKPERISVVMTPYKRSIFNFGVWSFGNPPGNVTNEFLRWSFNVGTGHRTVLKTNFFKLNVERYLSFSFYAQQPNGILSFSFLNAQDYDTSFILSQTGYQRVYIDLNDFTGIWAQVSIEFADNGVNSALIWPLMLSMDTDNTPLPFETV